MGYLILYENINNFYTLSEKIEEGAFGKVIIYFLYRLFKENVSWVKS